ncbi:MAG: hypothetical protein OXC28_24925 [Defluviicoccus sp.]|nr:hypothetical protein [Defluviicoccus sp.]
MSEARKVLLVGSIGLPDPETVFRTLSASVGDLAPCLPDGECGPRANWISWQQPLIARNDGFELAETTEIQLGGSMRTIEKYRLKEDVDPGAVDFGPLGYADAAIESYGLFKTLRSAGEVAAGARFQVSLPTPVAVVFQNFVARSQALVEPAYERAMLREVERIVDTIPLEDLALQWDVAHEVLAADGAWALYFDDPVGGALERLARLSARVPEPCLLGFHLCYGDPGHKHVKEPRDLAVCVAFANGLCARVPRRVDWVHMPVPKDRNDEAYFAPLGGIDLTPDTNLYLGLVHMTDGVAGARLRLAQAKKYVADFGIATECGFGRRPPETIRPLLDLHGEIARL